MSAPSYIGNSGGGIFNPKTRELVGIFTKIFTHGSLNPTIVPHLGLGVPTDQIHEFLDESGFVFQEDGTLQMKEQVDTGELVETIEDVVDADLSEVVFSGHPKTE